MVIRVEKFTREHFATVRGWWAERGGGNMPKGVLPPCGFVAFDETGQPSAAGWVYFPEGCKVAFLDWFVTRPGMRPRAARQCLRLVLASIEGEAVLRGRRHLLAATPFAIIAAEAAECGFEVVENNAIHLVKNLKP